jgi:orotidine-5'-phosphate decarboxylase
MRVVSAAAGRVGIVKPQVAFFERFGAAGYAALEDVLAAARSAGLLVIADVKRGDVGSTVEAYGQAWLTPGSPLEADALTATAYQGVGSLAAPLALARQNGKGVFVLAATSNPEAAIIQRALVVRDGETASVARVIIDDVTRFNDEAASASTHPERVGSIGVVLGATLDLSSFGIDIDTAHRPALPVLAPGFGHQGAALRDAAGIYGSMLDTTIVSESREVLSAGPDGIVDAITARADEVRNSLV